MARHVPAHNIDKLRLPISLNENALIELLLQTKTSTRKPSNFVIQICSYQVSTFFQFHHRTDFEYPTCLVVMAALKSHSNLLFHHQVKSKCSTFLNFQPQHGFLFLLQIFQLRCNNNKNLLLTKHCLNI